MNLYPHQEWSLDATEARKGGQMSKAVLVLEMPEGCMEAATKENQTMIMEGL